MNNGDLDGLICVRLHKTVAIVIFRGFRGVCYKFATLATTEIGFVPDFVAASNPYKIRDFCPITTTYYNYYNKIIYIYI